MRPLCGKRTSNVFLFCFFLILYLSYHSMCETWYVISSICSSIMMKSWLLLKVNYLQILRNLFILENRLSIHTFCSSSCANAIDVAFVFDFYLWLFSHLGVTNDISIIEFLCDREILKLSWCNFDFKEYIHTADCSFNSLDPVSSWKSWCKKYGQWVM